MINCGDPAFGGAMYGCSSCGTLKFVPYRCHSRFCSTCGTKYSIDRTTSMSFKIINVGHRHCVFTIDSELRHFFLEDRSLLSLLFEAVQSVIFYMFHKINKSEAFTQINVTLRLLLNTSVAILDALSLQPLELIIMTVKM